MKVLILTSWYPNKKHKVSGVFVREQAKALLSVGVEPVVFFPYDLSLGSNVLSEGIEDGIKTYRANTDYLKNTKLSRINSIFKSMGYLKKIVKENDIDIIHSHVCYPSGFVASFYKKAHKMPYVITEHMSHVAEYAKKSYNRIMLKDAYKNADMVITVSSFLASELKNIGFEFKNKIVGNVVDVHEYDRPKKVRNKTIEMLSIGLMDISEVKGIQNLLPAIADFLKHHPEYDIRLSLVGGGVKKKDYEKLTEDLGISDRCTFYGTVDKSKIPGLIARCDFLVHPSLKETFGSVLIEAMAGGKPVLATKCGGPEEFVTDETGILVQPGSKDALEEGILRMIEQLDKFDSDKIKLYIENNYSYNAVGNNLKELYKLILG